jgi:hypothetical protein
MKYRIMSIQELQVLLFRKLEPGVLDLGFIRAFWFIRNPSQRMKSVDKKLDFGSLMILVKMSLLISVSLAATRVLMESTRKVSETYSIPSIESFLTVKGKVSGPRWHWLLRLTLQT